MTFEVVLTVALGAGGCVWLVLTEAEELELTCKVSDAVWREKMASTAISTKIFLINLNFIVLHFIVANFHYPNSRIVFITKTSNFLPFS